MTPKDTAKEQKARATARALAAKRGVSLVQRGLKVFTVASDGTEDLLSIRKTGGGVWESARKSQRKRWRHKALVVPYRSDGRILLQGRSNISLHGAEWGFFGGGLKRGETPTQAALREMREELEWKRLLGLRPIGAIRTPMNYMRYVFIAPLPTDWMRRFVLKEGNRRKLFTLQAARALKGPTESILELVKRTMPRKP